MKLSSKSWSDYITKLSQINKSAADKMRAWVEVNGTNDAEAMIRYAYALVTKYGEASSALACEMYDAMAELEKVSLPAAEPAPTATYKETAKAINGAALRGAGMIPGVVDRLTKQAGQDTTVHNAIRDGAEWAWIPKGDTCAFCITLASNGWQRASVGLLRGNHAEHIHANCDCAFAIRHDKDGDVAGYNPEQYLLVYKNADGLKPKDKINAMRRANYEKNKEAINAQKRLVYARKHKSDADFQEKIKNRREEYFARKSAPKNVLGQVIQFDEKISAESKRIIETLASEYDTRLYKVTVGAEKAAGTVDVGGTMRISSKKGDVPIHEFAHSIAQINTDKLGITDNKAFWDEIKKLQRKYRKEVGDDSSKWISAYEHSKRDADEFLAEAFAHAKLVEMGMEVPERYGNLKYSREVLAIIDKYFKKKS